MSGFLYFVPQEKTDVGPADLARWGIAHAFERGHSKAIPDPCPFPVPPGTRGMVLGPEENWPAGSRVGFYPDRQTWKPMVGAASGVMIGWEHGNPPGPADLARARQLPGHWVKLEDGREWLVPMARRYVELDDVAAFMPSLPQALQLDAGGQWTRGATLPAYARLDAIAARVQGLFAAAQNDGKLSIDDQEAAPMCVDALAFNYRVGPNEVSAMSLLSDGVYFEVLLAVFDWPGFQAVKKKQAGAGSAGSNG